MTTDWSELERDALAENGGLIGNEEVLVGAAGEPEGFFAENAGRKRRVFGAIGGEADDTVGNGEDGIVGLDDEVAKAKAGGEAELRAAGPTKVLS